MNKPINSPFRYAGGKFYARHLILEHIRPHQTYIEPFAGGASIFFAKNKSKHNYLNDLDADLVNTYLAIKDNPQTLINVLENEQALKERHSFYKNDFKPSNNLERAQRWYYLNRTSYSGIMNMKNCYWGYGDKYSMRPENWGASILRTSQKLQGVEITNIDFEVLIDSITIEQNAFLFIDPPYFNADQDKFYTCSFTIQDHIRLAEVLKRNAHKFHFLITYDNSPEIIELYQWVDTILEKEWNYTISRTDDQKKPKENEAVITKKGERSKGKEIFLMNYETSKQMNLLELALENS